MLNCSISQLLFTYRALKQTIYRIGTDNRCDVHSMVLGIREKKDGWFQLYCPGGIACDDEGELYGDIVSGVRRENINNLTL